MLQDNEKESESVIEKVAGGCSKKSVKKRGQPCDFLLIQECRWGSVFQINNVFQEAGGTNDELLEKFLIFLQVVGARRKGM